MTTSSLKMGLREWLLLVSLATLWGGSFFLIELAVRALPVFTIVTARVAIAAFILLIFVTIKGQAMPKSLGMWGQFLLLGALRAAIPISLIVWAETQIDSGLASILNSTSPIFTMIVAHLLLKDEKLTSAKVIGVSVATLGIVVMIGADALQGLGLQVLAQLAMLGATCSYGFAAVYGRRFKGVPAAVSASSMLFGATLLTLPFALFLEKPWAIPASTQLTVSILAVLALALLSTALAFVIWFQLIHSAGAANTSMVTFLIPLVGLLLGVFVLGERLEPTSIIALILILLGLAIATNRFTKK